MSDKRLLHGRSGRTTEFVWYHSWRRKIEDAKIGSARFLVRCQWVLSRRGRALTLHVRLHFADGSGCIPTPRHVTDHPDASRRRCEDTEQDRSRGRLDTVYRQV